MVAPDMMRHFWSATLLLLAALAGGALLWGAIHALWAPPVPHHKLVKYGALLTAAVVLFVWARHRFSRLDLGLQDHARALARQGVLAFVLTTLALLPLWLFLVQQEARLPSVHGWGASFARLPVFLIGALAVAVVEELYFRGVLLARGGGRVGGILIAQSLLYAGIHFLNPAENPMLGTDWIDGWIVLMHAAHDMPAQWLEQVERLTLLILVGLGLGLLRLHTGRLALCIGVHAAMVFSLKAFQQFTTPGTSTAMLDIDSTGGWAAATWIGILLVLGLGYAYRAR